MPNKAYSFYLDLMAKPSVFRRLLNLWPPFLFSGISVESVSDDYRQIVVKLSARFFNRNHFGVHFGGSIYAMTDPFFVFMILHNLDGRYFVWDKAGTIEYVKPGKGHVTAVMSIDDKDLEEIVEKCANGEKFEPSFTTAVKDANGETVARLIKTIYIKLKPKYRSESD